MFSLMTKLTFSALVVLAISLFTSMSLMAGFHILIIPPILYFSFHYQWKTFPKSGWALLVFSLILIISVLANQSLIGNGLKNIIKVKYFILGALSLIPLGKYFLGLNTEARNKHIRILLIVFLLAASIATIAGMIGFFTGFNPLKMREVTMKRNGGMFGMLMTYAHSVALLCSLLLAAIHHRLTLRSWIKAEVLFISFTIAYIGLFTTYTRGAMIAFLVSILYYNRKFFVIMTTLTVLGYVGLSKIQRSSSDTEKDFVKSNVVRQESNDQRLGSWLGAWSAFKERPLLGYGYLNYEPHSLEIKARNKTPNPDYPGHAHNNFLEVMATAGIFGIIAFFAWIGLWFKELASRLENLATLPIAFAICFFVGGLTQVTLNDGENAFFIMAVYALSCLIPGKVLQSNL